jgi:glycosyltransferase involved in cell wall biosynthesis
MISHILFFGSLMLPEESQRNPCSSYSANRFQYEMLLNLQGHHVERISAVCPIPLFSYPGTRKLLVRGMTRTAGESFRIISPPFVNWGPLKIASLIPSVIRSALHAVRAWGRPQAIFLYNPYLGYTIPAALLAAALRIPLIGVVADLNPPSRWTLGGLARQFEARLQHRLIRGFDGLMPFSSHTAHDLRFSRPVMRLDPGVSVADFAALEPTPSTLCEQIVLFCGTLSEENGLGFLLAAFDKIRHPTLELWISGRGEMEGQIKSLAEHHPRIRYIGFMERTKLLTVIQHSLLLANPRPPSLPQHRYNFPGKILEYLASGRPVLSLASADIASEYGKYLILLKEETTDAFARLIDEAASRNPRELDEFGKFGRKYVLDEKNWTVLSQKVAAFVEQIVQDFDN